MGAQWKQAGREINAHKKGQMVVKLVREIMVAAKLASLFRMPGAGGMNGGGDTNGQH